VPGNFALVMMEKLLLLIAGENILGYVEGSLTIEFKEPQKSLTIKKGIKATFYQLMTFVATKSKNFNN
jgi:hypothetical protein